MLKSRGYEIAITAGDVTRFQAIAVLLAMEGAGYPGIVYTPAMEVLRKVGVQATRDEVLLAGIQSPASVSAYSGLFDGSTIAAEVFLLDWAVVNVRFVERRRLGRGGASTSCQLIVAHDSFFKEPQQDVAEFRDRLSQELRASRLTDKDNWSDLSIGSVAPDQEHLESVLGMVAPTVPSPAELRGARALADRDLRRAFIDLKRGKGDGGTFLDQMSRAGLVERSPKVRPSDFGKRLADKSRWMRSLAVKSLLDEGVPPEAIRVPANDGNDEDDLVFAVGDVFLCELKDGHFHEGHAKKFAARLMPLDLGVIALVISSDTISNEAREYLDRVIAHSGPNLPSRTWSPKRVHYLEGATSVTTKLRDIVRAHSADVVAREFRLDALGRGIDMSTILALKLVPVRELVEEFAKSPEGARLLEDLRSRARTQPRPGAP